VDEGEQVPTGSTGIRSDHTEHGIDGYGSVDSIPTRTEDLDTGEGSEIVW
jgi:hypothetical protein